MSAYRMFIIQYSLKVIYGTLFAISFLTFLLKWEFELPDFFPFLMSVVIYPNLCIPIAYGCRQSIAYYLKNFDLVSYQLMHEVRINKYLNKYIIKAFIFSNIFVYSFLFLQMIYFKFSDKTISLIYSSILPVFIAILLNDLSRRIDQQLMQNHNISQHQMKPTIPDERIPIMPVSLRIIAITAQIATVFFMILAPLPPSKIMRIYLFSIPSGFAIILNVISSYISKPRI